MPSQLNLVAVLFLRPLTRSIYMRPYLRPLAGRPILAELARLVLEQAGARRLVIVFHYEQERAALAQATEGTGAELYLTSHRTEVQAMAELAEHGDEELFASIQLGLTVAPADLLTRLAAHHQQHQNPFTLIEGIPAECLVSLYNRPVLAHLGKAVANTDFASPEVALRSMTMLSARTQGKTPIQLQAKAFDFLQSYGVTEEKLPVGFFLHERMEYEQVERALTDARAAGDDLNSASVLCRLRRLQTTRKAAATQLAPALQLPRPARSDGKKRILFMSPPSAFSGAEQALCSMVKFLDRERFTLLAVIDHEGVFVDQLRALGVEVHCPARELLVQDMERLAFLLDLFHQLQPDIVHLNGRGSLPIVAAARLFGAPLVQHIRNGDLRGFDDGLLAADALICITDFLKQETLKFPVLEERICVIHDEVDTEFYNPALFDKAACRQEFGLDATAPTVLMIARVVPNKRYDLMLQAAAQLRHRIPNLQLVLKGDVYGESAYHRKVRELEQKLKLSDCVRWFDFVPDIRTLIAAADVLVLCSDREGLGSCVIEAQSMAVPVIVTDTGGTHEVVESGVSGGFVIPGNDYGHLTSRLAELLENEALRQQLGQAGRQRVQQQLDARISARRVMEIYDRLLSAAR